VFIKKVCTYAAVAGGMLPSIFQNSHPKNLFDEQGLFQKGPEDNFALPVDHAHNHPEPPGNYGPPLITIQAVTTRTASATTSTTLSPNLLG